MRKQKKDVAFPITADVLKNISEMYAALAAGKSVAGNSANGKKVRDYSNLPDDITVYAHT